MVKRQESVFQLFITHQQLPEPVEPAVAGLHHPAAGLLFRISLSLLCFALAADHVRNVPMRQDDRHRLLATVRSIGAQVLGASLLGIGALDDDGIKHRLDLRDIVRIGAGDHQRQRDATPVH